MTYGCDGRGGLDYAPCRYGASRIAFRGPRKSCRGDYAAFLGGTETFGRFVPEPFVSLFETATGIPSVNLGVVNAGLDVYLQDPTVLGLACDARRVIIEVMGAQNMSNRFYSVHPRRNDRFVKASPLLTALYPEIDFTDFAFTRAMLQALQAADCERFAQVVAEAQAGWMARMKQLLAQFPGEATLLWCADSPPPEQIDPRRHEALDIGPLFITGEMLEALRPRLRAVVVSVRSAEARAMAADGLVHSDFDAAAAERVLGPAAHRDIAAALTEALAALPAHA
ncbi:DUF6473 family protein [Roseivivax sp. CAU 1761]